MRVFCLFSDFLLPPIMMQQPPTPAAPATRPGLARRWWRAANEPLYYDPERSILRQILWRALLWTPVVLPVIAAALFGAFHFLTIWRAHSLAEQAMESARAGAVVKARLQAMSASNLRKNDPEVRRAAVFVGSKMNDPQALEHWQSLSESVELTAEEAAEYATVALLFGTGEQFDRAHGLLERAGDPGKAASLRAAKELRGGNMSKSVEAARAAAASGEPAKQLDLARLLVARHGPAMVIAREPAPEDLKGAEEATALIEGLRGSPQEAEALGLGLALLPVSMEQARSWAEAALASGDPASPALIPAAQFLAETDTIPVDDLLEKLRPIFGKAGAEQKAAFAQWLNRHGQAAETLTLLTAEDATGNPHAFAARGAALGSLGRWDAVMEMTDKASTVPESLRLTTRALAATRTGRADLVPALIAEAISAGAREGRLQEALTAIDRMSGQQVANDSLLSLCGDPSIAHAAFPAARDRFARLGELELRRQAWDLARSAAPEAPSVRDFGRRLEILAGKPVDLRETAAAMVSRDHSPRLTHALALLRAQRAGEALDVVRESGLRPDQLAPADAAVVVAVSSANDQPQMAAAARDLTRPEMLEPQEQALLEAKP